LGSGPVSPRVSIRQKIGIAGMRVRDRARMPDRAEALFGSRRDFSDIREQAVGIRAIDTTDLLDRIEVGQTPSIKDEIVSSPNLRDSIDRKANELIQGDGKVQQQERNGASIDQGHRQEHQEARLADVLPQRSFELLLGNEGFRRKILRRQLDLLLLHVNTECTGMAVGSWVWHYSCTC
jgi:hypothetical protein